MEFQVKLDLAHFVSTAYHLLVLLDGFPEESMQVISENKSSTADSRQIADRPSSKLQSLDFSLGCDDFLRQFLQHKPHKPSHKPSHQNLTSSTIKMGTTMLLKKNHKVSWLLKDMLDAYPTDFITARVTGCPTSLSWARV